jgi:hypothetical protein
MDIIINKLQNSKKIIQIFDDYYLRLAPLIPDKYDQEYNNLSLVIKKLPITKKRVSEVLNNSSPILDDKNVSFEKGFHLVFDLYHRLQNFYLSIDNIYIAFNQTYLSAPNIDTDVYSKTYKLETQDYLNKLKLQYNTFIRTHTADDILIIQALSEILLKLFTVKHLQEKIEPDDVVASIKYIRSVFYQFKNTVSLYAKFIQRLMDVLYTKSYDGKQIIIKIMDIIEDDKDFFISGNIGNTYGKKHKSIHLTNPPLKRFGLLPVTDLMPINKLTNIILEKPTSGGIVFQQYAKRENVGFIIISRVVYHPMEYNIRPLIVKKLSADLTQPKEYGVTKKIVDRFNNIKQIETPNIKWDFNYKIVGDYKNSDVKNMYVIETLDGKNYRALAPWVYSTKFSIVKHKLEQFIKYITNDNMPDRISNYQAVSIKQSIPNMFLYRQLSTDILKENSKEIDTQMIRNDLYLKVFSLIQDLINRDYNKGVNVIGNIQINEIIHNNCIRDIFISVILNYYSAGTESVSSQNYNAGKFPFSELLSSYMKDIHNISQRFMKELHDGYNRNPIKESVFQKPVNERTEYIIDQLKKILVKVIHTIVNNKDNIYVTLNYKYLLLNFH